MCGRFALSATPEQLAHQFHLKRQVTVEPRYNIAPSQQVVIIRSGANGYTTSSVRWGLIPHWSKDDNFSAKLINARAETVQDKPAFREAFKERRCLIPATGFYEWKQEGNRRQPYYIKIKNGGLFAMAGMGVLAKLGWRNHRILRHHYHRGQYHRRKDPRQDARYLSRKQLWTVAFDNERWEITQRLLETL